MGGILELVERLRTWQGIVFVIVVAVIIYFGWKYMMGNPEDSDKPKQ